MPSLSPDWGGRMFSPAARRLMRRSENPGRNRKQSRSASAGIRVSGRWPGCLRRRRQGFAQIRTRGRGVSHRAGAEDGQVADPGSPSPALLPQRRAGIARSPLRIPMALGLWSRQETETPARTRPSVRPPGHRATGAGPCPSGRVGHRPEPEAAHHHRAEEIENVPWSKPRSGSSRGPGTARRRCRPGSRNSRTPWAAGRWRSPRTAGLPSGRRPPAPPVAGGPVAGGSPEERLPAC